MSIKACTVGSHVERQCMCFTIDDRLKNPERMARHLGLLVKTDTPQDVCDVLY